MDTILLFGIILIFSALSSKLMGKLGMPILVGFIGIGVLINNWFQFENINLVRILCDFALLLIVFTGGFQTNFTKTKPVIIMSSILSAVGTVLTAVVAGAFAYFILGIEFYQAALMGAVISSTDAVSVFSILRTKHMELKNNLTSVLEFESGSNEPFAYMMTAILLTLSVGETQNVFFLLFWQITIGILSGVIFAKMGQFFINRLNLDIDSIYGVALCGIALFIFGAATQVGGNGLLAVYI
jgi:cell volume regulation protein A